MMTANIPDNISKSHVASIVFRLKEHILHITTREHQRKN